MKVGTSGIPGKKKEKKEKTPSLFNEMGHLRKRESLDSKSARGPRYVELRCSHYVFRYRLKVARKIAGFHEALCRVVQLTWAPGLL